MTGIESAASGDRGSPQIPVRRYYAGDGQLLYAVAGRPVRTWALVLPWRPMVTRINIDWHPSHEVARREASVHRPRYRLRGRRPRKIAARGMARMLPFLAGRALPSTVVSGPGRDEDE